MKYSPSKSPYTNPDNLRIMPDGTLVLKDGSDVAEYLRGWMEARKLTNPEPVNFFRKSDADWMILPRCA